MNVYNEILKYVLGHVGKVVLSLTQLENDSRNNQVSFGTNNGLKLFILFQVSEKLIQMDITKVNESNT